MIKNTIKFLILGILLSIVSQAQEKQTNKEKADLYFSLFKYKTASELYEHEFQHNKNYNVLRNLATCYIKMNDYHNALKSLELLWSSNKANVEDKEALADLYKTTEKYEDAKRIYFHLIQSDPNNFDLKNKLVGIDSARSWKSVDNDKVYNFQKINSPYSDIAPFYNNTNSIVFASENLLYDVVNMDQIENNKKKFDWNGNNFYKLYLVENCGQGKELLKGFDKIINNQYLHVGPICFNLKMDVAYITYTNSHFSKVQSIMLDYGLNKRKMKVKEKRLVIYECKKVNNEWQEPKPISINNSDKYSICHAAISPDENVLYFASDMPGGFGKFDIWYCKRDINGNWGEVQNCGSAINSKEDELFPFMNELGDLYFSSKGHVGMGGLDIFRANGFYNSWSQADNLKFPINSSFDDFGFSNSQSARDIGYFSSNRTGGNGSDDIYGFVLDYKNQKKKQLDLFVYDDETKIPLADAEIEIKKDGVKFMTLKSDQAGMASTILETGTTYELIVNKTEYRQFTMPMSINPLTSDKIKQDVAMIKALQYRTFSQGQTFELKNLYYDFNQSMIRYDASLILDELFILMNSKYPNMKVNLSSHTDSRGSQEYNLRLSQKRAESASNYLINKGINSTRIQKIGRGESVPVNGCVDGVNCSEVEHQRNRRTEITIISM